MNESQSILQLCRRLWRHISLKKRSNFGLLFVLMIVVSLAEVISIGALIPFLGVLTSPEFIFNEPQLKPILDYLGILQMDQIVLPVTVGFVIAIVIAGSLRLVFLWASTRLSFSTGAELGNGIYRKTLFQPYQVHISRNSSEVISGIITKSTMVIVNILLPVLSLIGSVVMIVAIMSMLILISPFISII
ncbi:MAG: ABC transporter ATP-binding protein, partial [SAR86 cluster bacterium]